MKTTTTCPECGTVFTRTHTSYKQPIYCSRSCANKKAGRMTEEVRLRISRVGPDHPNFKGGFTAASRQGTKRYAFLWVPPEERTAHPTTNKRGYIHRSHMNWNLAHPDDPVLPGQIIHHRDEDSLNDHPDNLEKMANQTEHARHHFSRPRKPLSEAHKRAISETKKRQAAETRLVPHLMLDVLCDQQVHRLTRSPVPKPLRPTLHRHLDAFPVHGPDGDATSPTIRTHKRLPVREPRPAPLTG